MDELKDVPTIDDSQAPDEVKEGGEVVEETGPETPGVDDENTNSESAPEATA